MAARISPGRSAVRPEPTKKPSSGSVRSPSRAAILQVAPSTINGGAELAHEAALQRLPPTVARLWMAMPPIDATASTRAG